MDLRSEALETRGLAGALTMVAHQMTVAGSPDIDVRIEGTARRLDAAHEHHLLRIGLEALTNALKHAGATRVDIVLRFNADAIELRVSDDGRGIGDASIGTAGAHFGLQGIRERVDKLGGTVTLHSDPGQGTLLSVTVPTESPSRSVAFPALREIWPRS